MKGERHPIKNPTIVEKFKTLNLFIDQIICGSDCILSVVGIKNFEFLKFKSFDPIVVHSGKLEALIDWLFHPRRCALVNNNDDWYMEAFFLTFKTFVEPSVLFQIFTKKFFESDRNNNKFLCEKILNAFLFWSLVRQRCVLSEFDDSNFCSSFVSFFEKISKKFDSSCHLILRGLKTSFPHYALPPIKNVGVSFENILQIVPYSFALHLTSKIFIYLFLFYFYFNFILF